MTYPQILGLAASHLSVQLRVAEQRRPGALVTVLRCLALTLQTLSTHEAVSAGDVEGNHHAVTDFELIDLISGFLDHAHGFMAEDVPR